MGGVSRKTGVVWPGLVAVGLIVLTWAVLSGAVGGWVLPPIETASAKEPEHGWKGTESALKKAIVSKRFGVAKGIVDELVQTAEVRGFKLIIKLAVGGHDYELDRHAGKYIVRVTDPKIRQLVFDEVAKGSSYKTKIVLLAVLKRWADDPKAFAALHGALASSRREVVFTAIKWIRELKRPDDSLPALVAALARHERKARGRIYNDLKKTLTALTGEELPAAADWKNYVKFRKKGQPAEKLRKRKKPPRGKGGTVVYKSPTFFSVTVDSDRILFVIDVSSSMNELDTVIQEPKRKPKKGGRGGGTVVADPPDGGSGTGVDEAKSKLVTRLFRVQNELIQTIQGLPPYARFNIMSFSHQIGYFESSGALTFASESTREKAISWVRRLTANGATRTDKAVVESFRSSEIDTIYLLTDGAPKDEKNQRIPPERVLGLAKSFNRFRKTRIHTIGFSQAGRRMKDFVLDLARQNDGKCILLE